MKQIALFMVVLLSSLVFGCTTENGDEATTIQISGTDELDGYIYRYDPDIICFSDNPMAILVGDSQLDDKIFGFVSFDLSAIGSTINSARLRLYQDYIWGNPYENLGAVVVDHVFIGGTLEETDFDSGLITSNVGTLSSNAAEEWKELDVSEAVRRDYTEGRDDSQFRLRFLQETDNDGSMDYIVFEDGENNRGTGNTPTLVVTYE